MITKEQKNVVVSAETAVAERDSASVRVDSSHSLSPFLDFFSEG